MVRRKWLSVQLRRFAYIIEFPRKLRVLMARQHSRSRSLFAMGQFNPLFISHSALKAGFHSPVSKPVDPAEFAFVIASLIRRLNRGEET
jgi:hypothetical protein